MLERTGGSCHNQDVNYDRRDGVMSENGMAGAESSDFEVVMGTALWEKKIKEWFHNLRRRQRNTGITENLRGRRSNMMKSWKRMCVWYWLELCFFRQAL